MYVYGVGGNRERLKRLSRLEQQMHYGPDTPLQNRPQSYARDPYASVRAAAGGGGRGPAPQAGAVRRAGVLGWWLDLTAPKVPQGPLSLDAREGLRKAELTSITILLVMAFLLALVSNSLADPSTGQAVSTMAAGLVIAGILNRTGRPGSARTRIAAYLVPGLMLLLLMGAIIQAKGGLRLIWFPAYDLMALPIFIASLTCGRRAPWLFAFVATAFIVGDFLLQPHALINAPGVTNFDDIAYETTIFTLWGMINRHISLCVFAAFFGWLGARSVEGAIRRADRAEEIAAMEHAIVEQKRQLDYGVQQILETHVRVANGDFSARAPLNQDNILWQIAASLNNLLSRLQKSGQAEYQLRRTEEEIRRLAVAIRDAQLGRAAIWPAPTGTAADLLLEVMGRGTRDAGQASLQPPHSYPQGASGYGPAMPPSYPQSGQMSQYGPPPSQAPDPGMPANNPWTVPYEDQQR
jgi:hypothetical protein